MVKYFKTLLKYLNRELLVIVLDKKRKNYYTYRHLIERIGQCAYIEDDFYRVSELAKISNYYYREELIHSRICINCKKERAAEGSWKCVTCKDRAELG